MLSVRYPEIKHWPSLLLAEIWQFVHFRGKTTRVPATGRGSAMPMTRKCDADRFFSTRSSDPLGSEVRTVPKRRDRSQ